MPSSATSQASVLPGGNAAETFVSLGEWSGLLARLGDHGFPVSPDREIRLAALLWRLGDVNASLQDWKSAAAYLAPIFCVRADDHALFSDLLRYRRGAVRSCDPILARCSGACRARRHPGLAPGQARRAVARARPEGFPLSDEECAALPIAQELDAKRLFVTADADAFGGLQERVFLSFLKGDKLDPTDPLTPEATEAMKREIGARFVRTQRVVAGLALAVAAELFLFKNSVAAFLTWFEYYIGRFLPPQTAPNWRWAALTAMCAALAASAWSAAREPEFLAANAAHPFFDPRLLHQTLWPRTFALLGTVFAVLGVGDGGPTILIGAITESW